MSQSTKNSMPLLHNSPLKQSSTPSPSLLLSQSTPPENSSPPLPSALLISSSNGWNPSTSSVAWSEEASLETGFSALRFSKSSNNLARPRVTRPGRFRTDISAERGRARLNVCDKVPGLSSYFTLLSALTSRFTLSSALTFPRFDSFLTGLGAGVEEADGVGGASGM